MDCRRVHHWAFSLTSALSERGQREGQGERPDRGARPRPAELPPRDRSACWGAEGGSSSLEPYGVTQRSSVPWKALCRVGSMYSAGAAVETFSDIGKHLQKARDATKPREESRKAHRKCKFLVFRGVLLTSSMFNSTSAALCGRCSCPFHSCSSTEVWLNTNASLAEIRQHVAERPASLLETPRRCYLGKCAHT